MPPQEAHLGDRAEDAVEVIERRLLQLHDDFVCHQKSGQKELAKTAQRTARMYIELLNKFQEDIGKPHRTLFHYWKKTLVYKSSGEEPPTRGLESKKIPFNVSKADFRGIKTPSIIPLNLAKINRAFDAFVNEGKPVLSPKKTKEGQAETPQKKAFRAMMGKYFSLEKEPNQHAAAMLTKAKIHMVLKKHAEEKAKLSEQQAAKEGSDPIHKRAANEEAMKWRLAALEQNELAHRAYYNANATAQSQILRTPAAGMKIPLRKGRKSGRPKK